MSNTSINNSETFELFPEHAGCVVLFEFSDEGWDVDSTVGFSNDEEGVIVELRIGFHPVFEVIEVLDGGSRKV